MEDIKALVKALQNKCKLQEREIGLLQQELGDKEKQLAAQKGYVNFLKTKLREAVEGETKDPTPAPTSSNAQ